MAFTPLRRQQMQIPMGEVINWADPLAQGIVGYVVHGKTSPGPNSITARSGIASARRKGVWLRLYLCRRDEWLCIAGYSTDHRIRPVEKKNPLAVFPCALCRDGRWRVWANAGPYNPTTAELFWMSTDQSLRISFILLNDAATIRFRFRSVALVWRKKARRDN